MKIIFQFDRYVADTMLYKKVNKDFFYTKYSLFNTFRSIFTKLYYNPIRYSYLQKYDIITTFSKIIKFIDLPYDLDKEGSNL